MTVEEIVKKIRTLPLKLRFHLLFAIYIDADSANARLRIVETYGEILVDLSKEILNLPREVCQLLVLSEIKQLVVK